MSAQAQPGTSRLLKSGHRAVCLLIARGREPTTPRSARDLVSLWCS